MNYKKYNNPSLDGIDIPDDYLIFDFDDKVDSLDVLQEMTSSRMHLSVRQKQAIRYAITCIKKVKESEIVVNKLAKVIADYKSIQK